MGHQHNLLTRVLAGKQVHGLGHPFAQLQQGFAAFGRVAGVALAPAAGVFGPIGRNLVLG